MGESAEDLFAVDVMLGEVDWLGSFLTAAAIIRKVKARQSIRAACLRLCRVFPGGALGRAERVLKQDYGAMTEG